MAIRWTNRNFRWIALGWIVFASAIAGASPSADSESTSGASNTVEPVQSEEYVRVLRTGCFSPFQTVEWSVVTLGGTPVARLRKTLVDYTENLGAMRLLTREEGAQLWSALEGYGLPWNEAKPSGEEPLLDSRCSCRVEIARNGETLEFEFDWNSESQQSVRRRVAQRVKKTVEEYVEHVPFRNVFFDPGVLGFVDIDSVPPSRVFLDGQDTQLSTPLETYELKAGEHSVTLRSLDGSLERTYSFRVQPGMTTVLRLDLR